jgi:hypothetical protein
MKTKLNSDANLLKHIIPDFAVGCRRPTPGNGYLEALTKPKVRVVTEEISEIVPEGIKLKSGEVLKVDMFICATGFDISFAPRFPLIGRNGINLAKQWKARPEAYLSMAAANFPNHFSTLILICHCANLYMLIVVYPSVSWPKLTCWPWISTSNHRTDNKVHNSHASQMPDAGHQGCRA